MSSPRKYELDLAYQKETPLTNETRALRYTDLSRMAGRNFNRLFEQSMRFDAEDEEEAEGGDSAQAKSDSCPGSSDAARIAGSDVNVAADGETTVTTHQKSMTTTTTTERKEAPQRKERQGSSKKKQLGVGDGSASKK